MGRGSSSETSFGEITRVGLDTFDSSRDHALALLGRFHRRKYQGMMTALDFENLLADDDVRALLADPQEEQHQLFAEEIVGASVGFLDKQERERRQLELNPVDLAYPWLVASGVTPLTTPLLITDRITPSVLHLRESKESKRTLCGGEIVAEQGWHLRGDRGAFVKGPQMACAECKKRLTSFPTDSEVVLSGTEEEIELLNSEEQEGLRELLYRTASEGLLKLVTEPLTRAERDDQLEELVNDGVNIPAADYCRRLAAERFLILPNKQKLAMLFRIPNTMLPEQERRVRGQFEILRECLKRCYGNDYSRLPWPEDADELLREVFDRCNELQPVAKLQREMTLRMMGAFWTRPLSWIGAGHRELMSECFEVFEQYPQERVYRPAWREKERQQSAATPS